MNLPSCAQIILSKINEFYRINSADSDDRVKFALGELFHQWSEVLAAADDASDDELFKLNISRAFLFQVYAVALSKNCFINDHSFTRDIIRTSFNLLVNHIDIFKNGYSTSITTFLISNLRLIMEILSTIISLVRYIDIDLFREDDHHLLIAMREHVDQDFSHDNLTEAIISFIWNISDNTVFVPILLHADYAKSIIEWMKTRQKKFREERQDAPIYILQNMSRHEDGIEQFNIYNALNIIEQIEQESNVCDNNPILMQIVMIRALLTDSNYIKLNSIKYSTKILDMLLQLTIDASKNENYRQDGTHVCEPLTIFAKLFNNDEIFYHILGKIEIKPSLTTQSIIELFISLLIKFYPNLSSDNNPLENFTCVLVLNILWIISCHEEYCQIINNHEQLIELIKNAANNEKNFVDTFMPRTMKSIQQAAIHILTNLDVNVQQF